MKNVVIKKLYLVLIVFASLYSMIYLLSKNYSYALENKYVYLSKLQDGDILFEGDKIVIDNFFNVYGFSYYGENTFGFYFDSIVDSVLLRYLDDGTEVRSMFCGISDECSILTYEEVYGVTNDDFYGWQVNVDDYGIIKFTDVFKEQVDEENEACEVVAIDNNKYYEYKDLEVFLDGEKLIKEDDRYSVGATMDDVDNETEKVISFDISEDDLSYYDYLEINFRDSGYFFDSTIDELNEIGTMYKSKLSENRIAQSSTVDFFNKFSMYFSSLLINLSKNDEYKISIITNRRHIETDFEDVIDSFLFYYYFQMADVRLLKEIENIDEYVKKKENEGKNLVYRTSCADSRVSSSFYTVPITEDEEIIDDGDKEDENPITYDYIWKIVVIFMASIVVFFIYYKNLKHNV